MTARRDRERHALFTVGRLVYVIGRSGTVSAVLDHERVRVTFADGATTDVYTWSPNIAPRV